MSQVRFLVEIDDNENVNVEVLGKSESILAMFLTVLHKHRTLALLLMLIMEQYLYFEKKIEKFGSLDEVLKHEAKEATKKLKVTDKN